MKKSCISGLENVKEFSLLLRLIADPLRIKILCYLAQISENQGCYVGTLQEAFDKAPNLISHHLGMLKRAELVSCSKEGTKRRYQLNLKKYQILKDGIITVFDL